VKELADAYLEAYKLRHRAVTFAAYALGNVKKHLGDQMAVDATDQTIKEFQSIRLREESAPKTINEK
jgi:hypothetical protein